jgi:hypothetical protein
MTAAGSIKLIDPDASVCEWANGDGYWIKGTGWETKITYSIERAWELAVELLVNRTVAQ